MSLSPQVCKKSYKVKIPTLGENCEFWLITVTDESGITNPNKDHAYLTDSGKLYIYNGKTLIQVNCDICFTQEERDKLEGIEEGANKYVLPVASSTELGGVLLGYTQDGRNYPVLKDEDGRIYVQVPWVEYSLPIAKDDTLGGIKTGYEQNGRFYPVLVDVDGNAYVNVPWTDTDTKYNVVSTTENGLAPMLPTENADNKFLNGEGEWVERTKITCTYASSGQTFDKDNNSGFLYYIPFNGDNPKTIMGIVTIKSTYFVNDVIGTITLMPVSQANVLIYYGNEIVGTNLINIEVKITELEDGLQVYIKFNYNVNSADDDTFEADFTEIRGFNYVP